MHTPPEFSFSASSDDRGSIQEDFLRIMENLRIHEAELSAQNFELMRIQDELKISEQQYAEIYDESPIGYATLDDSAGIVRCNGRLRDMLGISVIGGRPRKLLTDYIHEDDQSVFRLRYDAFFKVPSNKSYTVRLKGAFEQTIYVRIFAKKLSSFDDDLIHATFTDVTEIKHVENEMREQAYHDALTGLSNRKFFEVSLSKSFAYAKENRMKAGILYLDLDFFKKVNDTHGHEVGDLFLREVAARLKTIVGEQGIVSRLGGDEFVILVKERSASLSDISECLNNISTEVVQEITQPFLVAGMTLETSASIGITVFPRENVPLNQVINHADTAMYEAKSSGRNQVRFFKDEMQLGINRRIALEEELKKSIRADDFILFYQPKVNDSKKIVGAEALLRWCSPTRGVLPPNDFIPPAELAGLIVEIGKIVIDKSFSFIRSLNDRKLLHDDFILAINISASQLKAHNLVHICKQALDKYEIKASQVRLEITENVLLELEGGLAKDIYALQELGFTFSIDDFGTGYSSLAYLHRLPVSELKIDRSFVSGVEKNKNDNAIVETVLMLSERLGLDCVAEGVENSLQYEYLKKHNCSYFQGYMFSKPLEGDKFVRLLSSGKA